MELYPPPKKKKPHSMNGHFSARGIAPFNRGKTAEEVALMC